MTYDIDITIIKQFAILMDIDEATLASRLLNYPIVKYYLKMVDP